MKQSDVYLIEKLSVNNIRILIAEMVQKANSGHPGMAMGCSDFLFILLYYYMRFDPSNPKWFYRDRLILSAGHCSSLLYVLLHLFNFKNMSLKSLKNFRQIDSVTPGHPEYGKTEGVDASTGPLGSGFSTAVGMAIAAKNFIKQKNMKELDLKQKIYIICGDGCMMEGCLHESASLAGHLKLDNIICFYDCNSITIDGDLKKTLTENIKKRFESYNWRVIKIKNANNINQIKFGLSKAIITDGRPTLIIGNTIIAYNSPNKAGQALTHGQPLGNNEILAIKEYVNFPELYKSFYIIPEVLKFCRKRSKELIKLALKWNNSNELYKKIYNKKINIKSITYDNILKNINHTIDYSTRKLNWFILQEIAKSFISFLGGSADVASSTMVFIKNESYFDANNRLGRNIHFGVRELAMGFAINGISLYGIHVSYCSTFLVFSDYLKPTIRLAALQNLRVIYIFTHDSIFVGEDGPTHHPIEQLVMLRSIPRLLVIRPFGIDEIIQAWKVMLNYNGPSTLILTRQNIKTLPKKLTKNINLFKGAYILNDDIAPEYIIIATGSEVILAIKIAKMMKNIGLLVRVVSMPSWELFKNQDNEYKDNILLKHCKKISIELASTFGWKYFVGNSGLCIGLDEFGVSAPGKILSEKFNFTAKKIFIKIIKFFGINKINKILLKDDKK